MRTGVLLITTLLALPSFGPACAADVITDSFGQKVDPTLDQEVSLAREMRSKSLPGQYDPKASVDLLQKIVSENPDYYRATYNLALSLMELNPKATDTYVSVLNKAITIQKNHPEVVDGSIYNTLGYVYLNQQNYDAAKELFSTALSTEDKNSTWTNSAATYNLGRLYFETQDYGLSQQYLDTAIAKYGNPAAADLKRILIESK